MRGKTTPPLIKIPFLFIIIDPAVAENRKWIVPQYLAIGMSIQRGDLAWVER
jgi:hypothetical protein